MPTFNLNFSRPGGQVVAQYYDFIRLGRAGYTTVQPRHGRSPPLRGRPGRPGAVRPGLRRRSRPWDHRRVLARSHPGRGPGFNLYEFGDRLRAHGWLIAAYPLPADRQDEVIQRAVIRHGFSHDMADVLLADMRRSLDQLATHPPGRSLSHAEAGSFNHNATPARA